MDESETLLLRSLLCSPLVLAVLITLANAAKPVTVDDAAYLAFARHFASEPTDPYGFAVFWYSKPAPAMYVLCPPVVPYWLALGIHFFGESPVLLKLWMFPFVWVLAVSLRALLRRFARGAEDFAFPLLMLSPAVLPTVNLMLDIPAVALALAAVELFIRSVRSQRLPLALLAGAVAALAMQAKYSAFVAPAAIVWYGCTHRRIVATALALGICLGLFVAWERWIFAAYGESHFWYHAHEAAGAPPDGKNRVLAFLEDKGDFIPPLVGQLGGLAVGGGLLAGSALRVGRRWLRAIAVIWCVCFLLVGLIPHRWTVIAPDVTAVSAFWQTSGWVWLAFGAGCAGVLLFRKKKGLGVRSNADSWFLVGWLVIEMVAAVGMTPFAAARRVIGVSLVLGLLAARASSRVQRLQPARRPPQWILAIGIGAGVAIAALDTFDAFPEKVCAEISAEYTRPGPKRSTVWFAGHWGFQYYCERNGMQPLVFGARAGDYVVLPIYPAEGFFRPHIGFEVREPVEVGDVIADVEWTDWLPAQTVPNFYGGGDPVMARDYPRLHVRIYRLRANWSP